MRTITLVILVLFSAVLVSAEEYSYFEKAQHMAGAVCINAENTALAEAGEGPKAPEESLTGLSTVKFTVDQKKYDANLKKYSATKKEKFIEQCNKNLRTCLSEVVGFSITPVWKKGNWCQKAFDAEACDEALAKSIATVVYGDHVKKINHSEFCDIAIFETKNGKSSFPTKSTK